MKQKENKKVIIRTNEGSRWKDIFLLLFIQVSMAVHDGWMVTDSLKESSRRYSIFHVKHSYVT